MSEMRGRSSDTALAAPQGTACDLCQSEEAVDTLFTAKDWEYFVEGEWTLAQCRRCDYYWMNPCPPKEVLPSFYPPTYSAFTADSVMGLLFRLHFWLDARRVQKMIGPRGRVLDVGCGSGGWLQAMAKRGGWELYGVELNSKAAAHARGLGFKVQEGDLSSAVLEPESFDLIRMGHVIEHVPDPVDALCRAWKLLRPGGVLFAETPNIDCWDFHLFGRYWGALHFPRHVKFFTEPTLRRVCRMAGFSDPEIMPRIRTVGWSTAIQNWAVDRLGLKVPSHGRVSWYPLLIGLCLPFTIAQALVSRPATLAFVARKPMHAPQEASRSNL